MRGKYKGGVKVVSDDGSCGEWEATVGGWKKLKRGKMRAKRLIETLSKIVVNERVKLRQLLRLSWRHRRAVCGGWLVWEDNSLYG